MLPCFPPRVCERDCVDPWLPVAQQHVPSSLFAHEAVQPSSPMSASGSTDERAIHSMQPSSNPSFVTYNIVTIPNARETVEDLCRAFRLCSRLTTSCSERMRDSSSRLSLAAMRRQKSGGSALSPVSVSSVFLSPWIR